MYQSGAYVVYGIQGVCRVVGTEIQRVNRVRTEYLVLEPMVKQESRFYIPTGNSSAMAKLKPVLTADQMKEILSSSEVRGDCWIPEESRRKQYYRELASRSDRMMLLRMLSSLYRYRESQLAEGRKFHQCDDNFLRDTERLLGTEIALVLEMSYEDAKEYLRQMLK